jgi:hypothetical protein
MPGTPKSAARELRELSVDELAIDDEASFRHVALYADLKEILRRHGYRFRVLPDAYAGRWDRALVLNLTYWDANAGGDILADARLPSDVLTHAAWHHLAAGALDAGGAPGSAEALFVGEAIASAFDVYLVGRLLGHSPDSLFLQTQVPAMAESAQAAGLTEEGFEELLEAIAAGPDRAFEDLRELLYDASLALASCRDADQGLAALARFDGHRFAPLLHHYELSNWVLYARAYAHEPATPDLRVRELDASLRGAGEGALDWLTSAWVAPALSRPPAGQPAG